ncbi:MAG TPA: outer membrane beta-barrel protein [Kiritimatiellia bacterium]|nr:outer membrane beta-barrel protein [Kiritimatiellia bacterium]
MSMKRTFGLALATMMFSTPMVAMSETGSNWLQLKNRLRFEYDDNIYERGSDKTDSLKIIVQPEFHVNLGLQDATFLGLRYRPSFFYWADREPDDTDWHHDFDIVLNHKFAPRTTLGLKNTLRYAERPELVDRDVRVQSSADYLLNSTDGNLEHFLTPAVFTRVGGRYTILRFDDDALAKTDDYDVIAAGLTVGFKPAPASTVFADYRYEETSYDLSTRGSESHFLGVGLEQTFNPALIGTFRAGWQNKSFDNPSISDADDPYFDASVTFLPSPRTRITTGVGYSMTEADVFPFASQDRLQFFASVSHDLTAKIGLNLAGAYQKGEYKGSQVIISEDGKTFPDGEEEIVQLSGRVSYMINRSNWIELGYQYVDLSSDFRENFDRNRISVGWRTSL